MQRSLFIIPTTSYPIFMQWLLYATLLLLLVPSKSFASHPEKKKKSTSLHFRQNKHLKVAKRRIKRKKKRRKRRRRRRVGRCRDIFCASQVMRLDNQNSAASRKLNQKQIDDIVAPFFRRLERCLIQARRRDPRLSSAKVEFVISSRGRVVATRVNVKRRSSMARCMHRTMRRIRFPRSSIRYTVASFTLGLTH